MRHSLFSGIFFKHRFLPPPQFSSSPAPPPDYVASGRLHPAHSCADAVSTLPICLFVFPAFSLQSAILYKQNYPFASYPFRRFLLVIVNGSICGARLLIMFPAS